MYLPFMSNTLEVLELTMYTLGANQATVYPFAGALECVRFKIANMFVRYRRILFVSLHLCSVSFYQVDALCCADAAGVATSGRVAAVFPGGRWGIREEEQDFEDLEVVGRKVAAGTRARFKELPGLGFAHARVALLNADLASLVHSLLVQIRASSVVTAEQMQFAIQLDCARLAARLAAVQTQQRVSIC